MGDVDNASHSCNGFLDSYPGLTHTNEECGPSSNEISRRCIYVREVFHMIYVGTALGCFRELDFSVAMHG